MHSCNSKFRAQTWIAARDSKLGALRASPVGAVVPIAGHDARFGEDGVTVPVVLLLSRRGGRPGGIALAGLLLVLGVFAKRINILFAAEFQPLVGLAPGIPGGRPGQHFRPDEVYLSPRWRSVSSSA